MGIPPGTEALCLDEEVEAGMDGERDAFTDNLACLKRLLSDFLPKALEAYLRMNEFFVRKPLAPREVEDLQRNLVNARFKIIELQQCLKTDALIGREMIESPR
jgi:hypothetical protein